MQEPAPSRHSGLAAATSAADYQHLFDLSLDLLCIAGLDGYFRRVNPSWTRVLGWSEAELLAQPVVCFIHPEDVALTLKAREGLDRGIPVRGLENRYRCKDGSYRWFSWQSVAVPEAATVFAVARDITEQRQLEHERLILSKLESTGILAGGLAHDFNNLLASLMLNLEMISLCASTTAEQESYLLQAQQTIQSAKALTLQLIAFAEGGVTARRVVPLGALLEKSFDIALRGSALRGECEIAPDLWPADVDEGQLGQIIRNLVLNAREATAAGGRVRLRAENLRLDATTGLDLPVGDYVRIQVSDDGAGIPDDVLPKIFDPYFSTKQRSTQKGMGLGLTICRTVIQKHGGTIAVDSRPNRGTTVTCLLPARRPASDPVAVQPSASSSSGGRILVMDDERVFREILAMTLRQLGYDVELAQEGGEAVSLYERASAEGRPFAAVLLDLTVRGGLGGGETVKALRARDPAVRAVLMTGYGTEEIFRDCTRHGFMGALAKPFSTEALRRLLAGILTPTATAPTTPE